MKVQTTNKPAKEDLIRAKGKYEDIFSKIEENITLYTTFKDDMLLFYKEKTDLKEKLQIQQQIVGLNGQLTQLRNQKSELEQQYQGLLKEIN